MFKISVPTAKKTRRIKVTSINFLMSIRARFLFIPSTNETYRETLWKTYQITER